MATISASSDGMPNPDMNGKDGLRLPIALGELVIRCEYISTCGMAMCGR